MFGNQTPTWTITDLLGEYLQFAIMQCLALASALKSHNNLNYVGAINRDEVTIKVEVFVAVLRGPTRTVDAELQSGNSAAARHSLR